jgi:hypothetical protein
MPVCGHAEELAAEPLALIIGQHAALFHLETIASRGPGEEIFVEDPHRHQYHGKALIKSHSTVAGDGSWFKESARRKRPRQAR